MLFSSLSAFAARVDFLPVVPHSQSPLTATITFDTAICPAFNTPPVIQRLGNRVIVTVVAAEVCIPTVVSSSHAVTLGTFEPGEYTVEFRVQQGSSLTTAGSGVVYVRPALPSIVVEPSAVPAVYGNTLLVGGLPATSCPTQRCTGMVVTINGVSYEGVYENGGIRVNVPPLPPGAYDVSVRGADARTITQKGAFYAFDVAKAPVLSAVEPVIFPMLTELGGGFGSRWSTEATILNGSLSPVIPYNAVYPMTLCSPIPCDRVLMPNRYLHFDGGQYPHGALMYVPRDLAPLMDYSLRVRDLTKSAETAGVELPVIREKDLIERPPTYRLLDVPAGPNFRTKVRIYALDVTPNALVNVSAQPAKDILDGATFFNERVTLINGE
ncbi:MAG TPA: hypothetical protein VF698_16925, partial [Thermoanaerobaculia bacterium]